MAKTRTKSARSMPIALNDAMLLPRTSVIMDSARRYLNARTTRSTRSDLSARNVLSDRSADTPDCPPLADSTSTSDTSTTVASNVRDSDEKNCTAPSDARSSRNSAVKSHVKKRFALSRLRRSVSVMLACSIASSTELMTIASRKK